MEVICSKYSGFCGGVNNTVTNAEKTISNTKEKIYCLGQIVHNEEVVNKLEKMGMITISDIKEAPDNSCVIIRAHGEPISTYQEAETKNIKIIDLTCPKILAIREKIKNHINDSFIIIIGKKNHPETIGNISYCGPNSFVIEEEEDIPDSLIAFKNTTLKKIYVIAQTTISTEKFQYLTNRIKEKYSNYEVIIDNTICNITETRQKEIMELSKNVTKMIIIGGKNSSNTKELYNIAITNCQDTYLVQTIADLKTISFKTNDIVGIAAGASTPREIIEEIYQFLQKQN